MRKYFKGLCNSSICKVWLSFAWLAYYLMKTFPCTYTYICIYVHINTYMHMHQQNTWFFSAYFNCTQFWRWSMILCYLCMRCNDQIKVISIFISLDIYHFLCWEPWNSSQLTSWEMILIKCSLRISFKFPCPSDEERWK